MESNTRIVLLSGSNLDIKIFQRMFSSIVVLSYGHLLKDPLKFLDMLKVADLLWWEPPRGKHLHATKLNVLEQTLREVFMLGRTRHIGIVCMAPFSRYDSKYGQAPAVLSGARWKSILATWKPQSSITCSCFYVDPTRHNKFRLFSDNVNIPDRPCLVAESSVALS